jgi:hypothetical protein
MLWDIYKNREIKTIPHKQDYDIWVSRLTGEDIFQIKDALSDMIDGTDIQTSSWMPGADWTGTPFRPIYEKAANKNPDVAAKCFGLILWEVIMERPEKWGFGRYEKDGIPIEGMTYFQLKG